MYRGTTEKKVSIAPLRNFWEQKGLHRVFFVRLYHIHTLVSKLAHSNFVTRLWFLGFRISKGKNGTHIESVCLHVCLSVMNLFLRNGQRSQLVVYTKYKRRNLWCLKFDWKSRKLISSRVGTWIKLQLSLVFFGSLFQKSRFFFYYYMSDLYEM